MHRSLRFVDHALVLEQLHARVVARVDQHLAVAHQVEARIAGVRPVGDVVLNDAGDAGGARRILEIMGVGKIADRMVRVGHRFLQEQERVVDVRRRLALE